MVPSTLALVLLAMSSSSVEREPAPLQPRLVLTEPSFAPSPAQWPAVASERALLAYDPTGAGRRDLGTKWYGWEIIIVDVAVWTIGLAEQRYLGSTAVLAAYLLGGPIVHVVNGELWRSFASFGVRVGAPLLGLGVAALVYRWNGSDAETSDERMIDGMAGAFLGLFLGLAAAEAVDIAALARKRVWADEDGEPVAGRAQPPGLVIAPVLALRRDGGTVGVAATF